MRVGLPLLKNVLTLLAKTVLIPLELTATASASDAAIQMKIYGSGITLFIISNKEMKDIMETIKRLLSRLLHKDVSKTIENEAKQQNGGFLDILLGTLAAIALIFTGKAKMPVERVIRAHDGAMRTG